MTWSFDELRTRPLLPGEESEVCERCPKRKSLPVNQARLFDNDEVAGYRCAQHGTAEGREWGVGVTTEGVAIYEHYMVKGKSASKVLVRCLECANEHRVKDRPCVEQLLVCPECGASAYRRKE